RDRCWRNLLGILPYGEQFDDHKVKYPINFSNTYLYHFPEVILIIVEIGVGEIYWVFYLMVSSLMTIR
ncbi:hypothetical protein PS028_24285, partial [Shigella sonnei]|nr:hypothetical protein [Shigella sonnei]